MSTSAIHSNAYPVKHLMTQAQAAEPDLSGANQPASTGMGRDMVRGLALVMIAGVLAVVVQLTENLLLARTGVGHVLGWLVLWSVLLAALLMLSRVSVRVSHAVIAWLDRSAFQRAQARSRARHGISAS